MSRIVFLGPFFACRPRQEVVDRPYYRCPSADCHNGTYARSIKSENFCPHCGASIATFTERVTSTVPREYDVAKATGGHLKKLYIVEERDYWDYWLPAVSRDRNAPREFTVEGDSVVTGAEPDGAGGLVGFFASGEVDWLTKQYTGEHAALNRLYGDDMVKAEWGLVVWGSDDDGYC